MFNIKSLAIAATADMPVRDASGEPQFDAAGNPLSITLYGPGTKRFQKAKHAADERANTRTFARMQGKSEGKQSAEEKNAERAQFLAEVTESFNYFGYEDKAGFEMFKAAYADIEIGHMADDTDKWLAERGNFKKASSKPSESTSDTSLG